MSAAAGGALRLLCVTGSLAHGGAERHAVSLLNRLGARGHECHLAYVKNPSAQLDRWQRSGRGAVHGLGATQYLDRRALADLARLMDRIAPEVILAQNPYALLYASLARRLARRRAPIVAVFHSNRLLGLKEQLQMAAYRPLYWTAASTVFVCESQRKHWCRRLVLSRRNEVIHNGVDTDAFRPAQGPEAGLAMRERLGFAARDYVIGIAAGLRPEKHHLLLVDAIAALRRRGLPARALLIGDGEMRPAIEARARAHGIAAAITIAGFQQDVRPYVHACDTMTLCSRTEALPLAAIEAMALGKPVVLSAVGGAGEIVTESVDGWLFPPGDCASYAARLADLADQPHRERLGENARAAVLRRFSETAMVERYERLLREVAAARGTRVPERARRAPAVLVLGPGLDAVSGVSSHLRALFGSALGERFDLVHFRVGSEGRSEGLPARMLRQAASPISLARAIRRHGARIVHLNTSLNAGAFWRDLAYALVARASGARVVCQVHGGALPQDFLGSLSACRALLRWALGRANVVVVLARAELDAYRRFLPGQNVVHVPNAVDCATPAPRQAAEGPLQLLYLGRLVHEKGLREILGALASVNREGARARLTIAGSGRAEAELRALAAELGLGEAVRFAGTVAGMEKERLLAESDVFLLPSYAEGLPYALIEGMAAGLAVVATPVGAIPDLVSHGVQGLLVPAGDAAAIAGAVLALAGDRARLARMGEAAQARVREACSVERMAGRFTEIYGDLGGPGTGWPSLAG